MMSRNRPRQPNSSLGAGTANSEMRLRTSRVVKPSASPELAAPEGRYRTIVEHSSDAIVIFEHDSGAFVEVNRAGGELFGCSENFQLKQSFKGLFASEDVADAVMTELADSGHATRSRIQLLRPDGLQFFADVTVASIGAGAGRQCVVVIRDVSQQVHRERDLALANETLREAQAQLVHSSKLAAIGELAAGVAHEVNNPAAFVSVYLSEVRREVARVEGRMLRLKAKYAGNLEVQAALGELEGGVRPFSELHEMLVDSIDGVQRIAATVKELRAFSRVEREDAELLDINEIVRTAFKVCHTQIRYRARLEESLLATRNVVGSRGRLIQVITNLLTNAAQAIEDGGAEQHRIRVSTEDADDYLRICVEDTGSGMDAETRARIFQPFFTTKSREVGTGLGLALCANIVRDHLGEISVQSKPGGPTRFEVRIPFNTGLIPRYSKASLSPSPQPHLRKKVLIIDDEVQLLRAYQRSLSRYHDVETAVGGEAGLARILQTPDLDLIVCDLMMPNVDGVAVHAALSKQAPHLLKRLVFSTGGVFTKRCQDFLSSAGNVHLQKPLVIEAIEEALAGLSANPETPDPILQG
mgnify:CR=1 FL=1